MRDREAEADKETGRGERKHQRKRQTGSRWTIDCVENIRTATAGVEGVVGGADEDVTAGPGDNKPVALPSSSGEASAETAAGVTAAVALAAAPSAAPSVSPSGIVIALRDFRLSSNFFVLTFSSTVSAFSPAHMGSKRVRKCTLCDKFQIEPLLHAHHCKTCPLLDSESFGSHLEDQDIRASPVVPLSRCRRLEKKPRSSKSRCNCERSELGERECVIH